MTVIAYCTRDDLLLGNLQPPASSVLDAYVQDGADAIDTKLGFRYSTPIVIDPSVPGANASMKLLRRINVWLASGMYIAASSTSAEDIQLNAYAKMLLADANAALESIASGQQILPGAGGDESTDVVISGPIILNVDSTSGVEDFYKYVKDPCRSGFKDYGLNRLFPHNINGGG